MYLVNAHREITVLVVVLLHVSDRLIDHREERTKRTQPIHNKVNILAMIDNKTICSNNETEKGDLGSFFSSEPTTQ